MTSLEIIPGMALGKIIDVSPVPRKRATPEEPAIREMVRKKYPSRRHNLTRAVKDPPPQLDLGKIK
ncbi:MAG: hypothetical protein Q7S79_02405 [bacterium]|nr:hypothetical protein [bacterium]